MLADWQDQVVVNFIMATGGRSVSVSGVRLFRFVFSFLTTAEQPHTLNDPKNYCRAPENSNNNNRIPLKLLALR